MARVVIFVVFTSLVLFFLALQSNKNLPISNTYFNYEEYKNTYDKNKALVEELNKEKPEETEVASMKEAEVVPQIVLETESEKRGAEVYAKKCKVCHGKYAEGKKSQNAPRLAGQFDWYIVSQLQAMKEGKRVNKVMNPYLKNLDNSDFEDLGAYLSKYSWK